jgi:hypothetical protein
LARTIERWRAGRSPHWLVAALWKVQAPGPDTDALLDAARLLDRQSPAFPTAAFLGVRLLTRLGRHADARAVLASLPARPAPGFNAETVNLLEAERLQLAPTLDQFLAHAPRAVVVKWDGPIPYANGRLVLKPRSHDEPVLDEDAAVVLAERLPLSRLVDASLSRRLPRRLRLRVALAAFTRAIVLQRDEAAGRLIPVLRDLAPILGADLDRYARAATTADRHRAGVLLLLNTPGATIDIQGGDDDYGFDVVEPAREFDHVFRDNWWCPVPAQPGRRTSTTVQLLYERGIVLAPAFVTAAERGAVERELRALAAAGPARNYLALAAIRMAKADPADPGAGRALARVVEGWRWACGERDGSTTPLPQQAFVMLHRLFPESEAAQRTRYWYRD